MKKKTTFNFDTTNKKENASSKGIPNINLSKERVPRRTTSTNVKFTKTGQIMTDEHKKFRQRIKEINQRNTDQIIDSSSSKSEEVESILIMPSFVENNYVMNPIIGLYLKIEKDQMYLDKTKEDVISQITDSIDQMITSCNFFPRPEFCKLNIISEYEFMKQEEEEEQMNKMTFKTEKKENEFEDFMFGGLERNIYSKYMGRIKLSKSEKDTKDIIFSKEETEIFKKSTVSKYMQVADVTEE